MLKNYLRADDGLTTEERKAEVKALKERLGALQIKLKDAKLPILIVIDGWESCGKGHIIRKLSNELDPRFRSCFSNEAAMEYADRYPFIYPYFNAIPENGKIVFMNGSWMDRSVKALVEERISKDEYLQQLRSAIRFERQLKDNGYVILKFFIDIPCALQEKLIEKYASDKNSSWRVTDADIKQNKKYEKYSKAYSDYISADSDIAPWHVIDGTQRSVAVCDALRIIVPEIENAIAAGRFTGEPFDETFPMSAPVRLKDADLTASVSDEEYQQELKRLQKKLAKQHDKLYRKKIPVVICFEGWDAAGKGGAIKRLAYPLDPRGCVVYPIASPEPHELARHYLWRFFTRLPRSGHIAIFDRTWYGRVMVERIEKYCGSNDWKRAYNEINEFEQELTDWGAVVLKFWIQIDQETQLARFNERQNTPEKRWKITDEDWRNREKWPKYERAVTEMLKKTSTEYAPWHVVESVDKKYARLKVLKIATEAIDKALEGK